MAKSEDQKTAAPAKTETTAPPPPDDTAIKELAFRLLWQSWRVVKGATHNEIGANFEKFRDWIGRERSEEIERQWRKGPPK